MKRWADGPSHGWKDERVGDNAGDLGGEGKSARCLAADEGDQRKTRRPTEAEDSTKGRENGHKPCGGNAQNTLPLTIV